MNIKNLIIRYKEILLYLISGFLTTLVNLVSYWCARFFMDVTPATAVAWVLSVLFAYFTNKIFVFKSRNETVLALIKEFCLFIFARLASGVVDVLGMTLLISDSSAKVFELVVKICINIFVVVVNYILSKFLIFKKKKETAG